VRLWVSLQSNGIGGSTGGSEKREGNNKGHGESLKFPKREEGSRGKKRRRCEEKKGQQAKKEGKKRRKKKKEERKKK